MLVSISVSAGVAFKMPKFLEVTRVYRQLFVLGMHISLQSIYILFIFIWQFRAIDFFVTYLAS